MDDGGTRLPKSAVVFCYGSIRHSPFLGTLGNSRGSFNIFTPEAAARTAAPTAAEHAHHKPACTHKPGNSPPTLHSISVADAARSLPQLVPPLYNYPPSISKLLLNCIIVAALWDLSFTHDCIYNAHSDIHSRMWHRAGRHFEISKCPARITNPILLN